MEQRFDEMASNEARSAGHQRSHRSLPLRGHGAAHWPRSVRGGWVGRAFLLVLVVRPGRRQGGPFRSRLHALVTSHGQALIARHRPVRDAAVGTGGTPDDRRTAPRYPAWHGLRTLEARGAA